MTTATPNTSAHAADRLDGCPHQSMADTPDAPSASPADAFTPTLGSDGLTREEQATMNDAIEPVPRPSGVAEFCNLASALFALDETGGPLHVHLDDHNTELLVGDEARGTITAYTHALALIEMGHAPDGNTCWGEPGEKALTTAYYYGPEWADERNQPLEQLRLSIRILTITEPWTEDQADAAYAEWESERGRPCGCSIYPTFIKEES